MDNYYYTATTTLITQGAFSLAFSDAYNGLFDGRVTWDAPYPEASDPDETVNLAYELFARTVGA